MPNVNCLQYACRGDGVDTVPDGTWTSDGWKYYKADPSGGGVAKHWSSLATAVRRLILARSPARIPKLGGKPDEKVSISAIVLKTSGISLLKLLSGKASGTWTAAGGTTALPTTDGTIVMGDFGGGSPHFFVRSGDSWMGVPGASDTVGREVTISGNRFEQKLESGSDTKSGNILGWMT